jgi:hypothetical protein
VRPFNLSVYFSSGLFVRSKVGPFNHSVNFSSGLFMMISWVSVCLPPVGETKSAGPFNLTFYFSYLLSLFVRLFNLSVYFSSGLFVTMSWISFFASLVGEITNGSVQSVCVLFLWLVCNDELDLLLRVPSS